MSRVREPSPKHRFSSLNTEGETLYVQEEGPIEDEGLVVATNSSGNSLTLLEEYSLRKQKQASFTEFYVALASATVSIAFAAFTALSYLQII